MKRAVLILLMLINSIWAQNSESPNKHVSDTVITNTIEHVNGWEKLIQVLTNIILVCGIYLGLKYAYHKIRVAYILIKIGNKIEFIFEIIFVLEKLEILVRNAIDTTSYLDNSTKIEIDSMIDDKYLDELFCYSYKLRLYLSPHKQLHLELGESFKSLVINLNELIITKDRMIKDYLTSFKKINELLPDLESEMKKILVDQEIKKESILSKHHPNKYITRFLKYFQPPKTTWFN